MYKRQTLPRLELCACLLLAQLASKVIDAVNYKFDELYFYSDSMIALHWIHQQSSRWKVFVANRVAEIQRLTTKGTWHHVSSLDNPADILSRGCLPRILHSHPQWWHGPSWLSHESSSWPISAFDTHSPCTHPNLEQERRKQAQTSLIVASSTSSYVENYSSLSRLIRVFSYCRRFIRNSRLPVADRDTSFLSAQELHDTLLVFIRQSQQ